MKTLCLVLSVLCSPLGALCQESHFYSIPVDSTKAVVPVPNPTMKGTATFGFSTGGEFGVNLLVLNPDQARITSVELFRSMSASELGIFVEALSLGSYDDPYFLPDGTSFIGGQEFDFWRTLNAMESADVAAGNWWIIAKTAEFPQGEIRAQLVVPEPAGIGLFGVGAVALFFFSRRDTK
jgi:hypothetical protein